jgi:hypothetical protein
MDGADRTVRFRYIPVPGYNKFINCKVKFALPPSVVYVPIFSALIAGALGCVSTLAGIPYSNRVKSTPAQRTDSVHVKSQITSEPIFRINQPRTRI